MDMRRLFTTPFMVRVDVGGDSFDAYISMGGP